MRRAVKPRPEAAVSGAGLRALARLIAVELGIPALAGVGPLVMHVEVADSATTHSAGRRPRPRPASAGPSPVPAAEPPAGNGAVSAEHQETWRLVQLAQQGDGEAFGQLYDRYVDTVFRFIYFRVNDRALAEDFTSETFLRALRRISSVNYQGRDIGAWFVTIARNIILDHMKSARHRLEITTDDTPERNDRAPGPEDAVLDLLTSERLMEAVRQLGDEQRECVMLRFIQGFSVSETAAVMGKNDGAIKALQHRAVRKLAELVGAELR
ncbi:MAG TPA: sigma-70 family RNA polymerase sigma factor [Jatrophihabitantaceae bacterium]|jgi:RNA polymerase sigma-70 factor (ECF subfamily)